MKKIIFISLGLAALSFYSCGKQEDEKKSESFKYNLTYNGCSTGDKEASSKDAMCALLKDDAANNFCAANLRKEKYEADGCGTW